jgi:hypothetical protein
MRGNDAVAGSLFSYVDLEKRVRPDHPLRVIQRQSGCDERDNQDEIARLDFGMIVAIFGFCNA